MAGNAQDMRQDPGDLLTGDFTGQAQMRREVGVNQPSHTQSAQPQATNILQQAGDQMQNMAHGAAEAVKSTLGTNPTDNSSNNINISRPSNNPNNAINPRTGI